MPTNPTQKRPLTRDEFESLKRRYSLSKYSCPSYVLFGTMRIEGKLKRGVLALTSVQTHAYLLRRELRRNGNVECLRTEFHPDGMEFELRQHQWQQSKRSKPPEAPSRRMEWLRKRLEADAAARALPEKKVRAPFLRLVTGSEPTRDPRRDW